MRHASEQVTTRLTPMQASRLRAALKEVGMTQSSFLQLAVVKAISAVEEEKIQRDERDAQKAAARSQRRASSVGLGIRDRLERSFPTPTDESQSFASVVAPPEDPPTAPKRGSSEVNARLMAETKPPVAGMAALMAAAMAPMAIGAVGDYLRTRSPSATEPELTDEPEQERPGESAMSRFLRTTSRRLD